MVPSKASYLQVMRHTWLPSPRLTHRQKSLLNKINELLWDRGIKQMNQVDVHFNSQAWEILHVLATFFFHLESQSKSMSSYAFLIKLF